MSGVFGRTAMGAVIVAVAVGAGAAILAGVISMPEPVVAVIRWGKLLQLFG